MKKYRYLIAGIVLTVFVIATILFWNNIYVYIKDPAAFVTYLQNVDKVKGTLIFCLLNYLQVILAFIPGGPFEIVAAYMYGAVWGTLICDVTMTLGSLTVFLLVRKFGIKIIELFINPQEIKDLHFLKDKEKLTSILFLLFLIPGTPKDAISYGVGLTDLPVINWIGICFIGRLPAILLTVLGATSLSAEKYGITIGIIVIFIVLYLIGLKVYQKINKE